MSRPLALIALIALQAVCAGFFIFDVLVDAVELKATGTLLELHFVIETAAAIALILGIAVEMRFLTRILKRKAYLEHQVGLAAGAFYDIIEDHFRRWSLTSAEEDVARFTVKGASIADIAKYRGSADGTIKSHLNAIYRKAGVNNRGELLSLLIDDMLGSPSQR